MKILWQYFSILISYSLFYVSLILFYFFIHIFFFFSPPHMHPYLFFLYFILSSFSLPLPPHTCPHFFSLFPSFVFFPTTSHSRMFHAELSTFFLFLFLFSFFLSPFSLATSSASFFPSIPSKHTNLKVTHNYTIWFSSNEVGSIKYTKECVLKKTKKEEEDGVRVSFRAKGKAKRWDERNEESGREN